MFIIFLKTLVLIFMVGIGVFAVCNKKTRFVIKDVFGPYKWQILVTALITTAILLISQIGT